MIEKYDRDFKGVWIPKEIWLDEELSIIEKIMLVEINSLDNEHGCYAGNEHFAKFFGITTVRVSQIIKRLKDLEYVQEVSFDGRKRILKTSFKIYFKAELNGNLKQTVSLFEGSDKENFKHSNTVSNSSNKQSNNTKKQHLSIFDQWYLAGDFKITAGLIAEWEKVNWQGVDPNCVENVLEFFKYRTEIGKPIKTSKGANGILNNIKTFAASDVIKLINKTMEREWVDLKFYDSDKKNEKSKWGEALNNIK